MNAESVRVLIFISDSVCLHLLSFLLCCKWHVDAGLSAVEPGAAATVFYSLYPTEQQSLPQETSKVLQLPRLILKMR